jgi:ABC-2 type transport system ATP-binding protein
MSAFEPLVTAEQLVFRYPEQTEPALRGVDVQLTRGHAVGLLGPNGSGKSTLINLLIGLRTPQAGRIRYAGGSAPVIAWVPQEYAFYPELTCRENLTLFAGMLELSSMDASRRVEAAITNCMLHEFIDRRARHCSGGVRRRLNLGIALLLKPDVLFLDRVRQFVNDGTAVLYATHYMEEVSAVCSHILLLDHGRVVASGDLETLLRGPAGGGPFENLEKLFMHYTQRQLRD